MSEDLEEFLNLSTSDEQVKQIAWLIWGAVVSTSRAFKKVAVKIDPETQRVFLSVELYWWAKSKRLEILRKYWLAKADRKCQPHVPTGWKKLIYYKVESNVRTDKRDD